MKLQEHSNEMAASAEKHHDLLLNSKVYIARVRELEISKGIKNLTILCHGASVNAGWYHDLATGEPLDMNIGERLMLIVSEVTEAFEANRKNLMDDHLPHRSGIEAELADVIIRIADLAGFLNLDLAGAIHEKRMYNLSRQDHTVEHRRSENGKKC